MAVDANTVSGILDEIGKRLSEPTEHTYEILVKQAVADGAGDLALCFLYVAGIGFALYFIPKLIKVCNNSDDEGKSGISAVAILLLGVWAVTSVFCLPFDLVDGIKHIINPEYYAIMDIVGKISGN